MDQTMLALARAPLVCAKAGKANRRRDARKKSPAKIAASKTKRTGLAPDLEFVRSTLLHDWNVEGADATPVFHPYQMCASETSPRMTLENELRVGEKFRRMHVETGTTEDGFQVLHCVITPDPALAMPIFGCDVVRRGTTTTMAITDVSPVGSTNGDDLRQQVRHLRGKMITHPIPRPVPEWGKAIFSPECLCITPRTPTDMVQWIHYTLAVHRAFLRAVKSAKPASDTDRRAAVNSISRYATHQRRNEKTALVLTKHYGREWTERYLQTMLFPDMARNLVDF